ncbi:uncharacterized protein LOC119587436 [Penaeus monodon]|uniref:uncharacterized protein LOC119587436 n=1 Tax=Penaeus monodon TaxID=6687 RepID=UPI0018A7B9B5|nr:uncharacterized protein LOC119587436 [Penaeus monodon]
MSASLIETLHLYMFELTWRPDRIEILPHTHTIRRKSSERAVKMLRLQLLSRGGVSLARIAAASTRTMATAANVSNGCQRSERKVCIQTSKRMFTNQFRLASTSSDAARKAQVLVAAAEPDGEAAMLKIHWGDSKTDIYPFIWLRDNCQCPQCFASSSLSRIILLQDLSRDVHPTGFQKANSRSQRPFRIISSPFPLTSWEKPPVFPQVLAGCGDPWGSIGRILPRENGELERLTEKNLGHPEETHYPGNFL